MSGWLCVYLLLASGEIREVKLTYTLVSGLPILIVTITLASASGRYAADGHCWLSVQNGVIWGFAGPVIFIIMVRLCPALQTEKPQ